MMPKVLYNNKKSQYGSLSTFVYILIFLVITILTLYDMPIDETQSINYLHIISYVMLYSILIYCIHYTINLDEMTLSHPTLKIKIAIMPMFFGIWIVILAGSISLMLGNVFIVFNFTLTLCIMIYIERWIRKDNKKYRIDWFWGRKKQKECNNEDENLNSEEGLNGSEQPKVDS